MAKRYRRTRIDVFQKRDVAIPLFPTGEGPPVYMSIMGPDWVRLAPGQGAAVDFSGEDGGAFAWGITSTLVAIWVHSAPGESERAFCQHLPQGPLNPMDHEAACGEIGFTRGGDPNSLRVLLAGRRDVTEADERAFMRFGVLPDRLMTYSNAHLTQFGVSRRGCAGEAG